MKNKTRVFVILLITFVVLTTVLLIVPLPKTPAFWIAYVFTVIAFSAQIPIWNIGFKKGETIKSKFLGIPIVHIGTVYLIVQSLSVVAFRFLLVKSWIAIVSSVVIVGIFSVLMISSQAARDEINRIEEKVKIKVDFIRLIQSDIELLADTETDAQIKHLLEDLAEKIRFSDPVSNEQLKPIEDKLVNKINELKSANNKTVLIGEIDTLLAERNIKTKILK